jgi:hypothetical protein
MGEEAAVTERWSNGPVEGQVNRLKTIQRQMYGQAGLELLRARLIPLPVETTVRRQVGSDASDGRDLDPRLWRACN